MVLFRITENKPSKMHNVRSYVYSRPCIKQESVIDPKTPNLEMGQVTCSIDIMSDMDDFARYIGNVYNISASEKSNVIAKKWIPEDFVFPKDHNKLCFKPSWSNTHKWLAYSKSCDGVYCVTCVLFGKEVNQFNIAKHSAFYKEPFCDWKHAIQRFKRHASSAIHKNADVDLMHLKNIKLDHKDVPINQQLNNTLRKGVGGNRKILRVLVNVVLLFAKQNIAYRGRHEDTKYVDDPNYNSGNYQEF